MGTWSEITKLTDSSPSASPNRILIMTTLSGADAALKAIKSLQGSEVQVRRLQE